MAYIPYSYEVSADAMARRGRQGAGHISPRLNTAGLPSGDEGGRPGFEDAE